MNLRVSVQVTCASEHCPPPPPRSLGWPWGAHAFTWRGGSARSICASFRADTFRADSEAERPFTRFILLPDFLFVFYSSFIYVSYLLVILFSPLPFPSFFLFSIIPSPFWFTARGYVWWRRVGGLGVGDWSLAGPLAPVGCLLGIGWVVCRRYAGCLLGAWRALGGACGPAGGWPSLPVSWHGASIRIWRVYSRPPGPSVS